MTPAVLGAPFDGGTTYRPGTRFGPQGVRKISALYTPYNYEIGVDLREQMSLCDAGDIFTIPGNIEKDLRPDQPRRVSHVFSIRLDFRSSLAATTPSAFPVCVASPSARPRPSVSSTSTVTPTSRRRTSTSGCTPRPGSTRPTCQTCPPRTLCKWASAAGRYPREAVKVARERDTNIITMGGHGEDGHRQDRRDGVGDGLGRGRHGLHVLRH